MVWGGHDAPPRTVRRALHLFQLYRLGQKLRSGAYDHVPVLGGVRASWECGPYYMVGRRYGIRLAAEVVTVSKLGRWPAVEWRRVLPIPPVTIRDLREVDRMASKYIAAAIKEVLGRKTLGGEGDYGLFKNRPAIREFMTDLEGVPGGSRELSVLMICVSEGGLRVGLKDADAGGWCWREGEDLGAALNAVEKALQAGSGAFRTAGANAKKSKRQG